MPISSITTPDQQKRLFVDWRMPPLLHGRRIALVDDAICTGRSITYGLQLLEAFGLSPMVIGAAMLQTKRWTEALQGQAVESVLRTPLLSA